jgi:hypothetical protein
MRTFISVENHKALQFEHTLEEFDLLIDCLNIRERDFMTDFIFEDLNEEEEATLEQLKNDLN